MRCWIRMSEKCLLFCCLTCLLWLMLSETISSNGCFTEVMGSTQCALDDDCVRCKQMLIFLILMTSGHLIKYLTSSNVYFCFWVTFGAGQIPDASNTINLPAFKCFKMLLICFNTSFSSCIIGFDLIQVMGVKLGLM